MAASDMRQVAFTVFRPPPGLTNDHHMDVPPPPGLERASMTCQGNYAHQMPASTPVEQWSPERPRNKLCLLAAISPSASFAAPLKVYPSEPPGIFRQHCDTCSAASTAASEVSEDSDEILETFAPISSPIALQPMEEAPKEFSRELQVEPFDMANDRPLKVCWPVDSRKLRCKDKQIVSPLFEIYPGCFFKLMLKPKAMGDRKHQEGFQRARGWGMVELKCVEGASLAPTLRFSISVGDGAVRGPVTHNFSENTVARLTKCDESLDFASAVDKDSLMFPVFLQAFRINLPAQARSLD